MKSKQILKSGLHALVWREEKLFISRCLEVKVASQGQNKKEALKNLEEAISLYFEDEKIPEPPSFSELELHTISQTSNYA